MQASQIPAKIQEAFAVNGQRNAIPVPSQASTTPGAASFNDGFPSLTMQPISSGGVPPSGKDMNGILYAITSILQWQCGGGFFAYDANWSSANGGYPKGAILQSAGGNDLWLNEADGNTTNPDATDGSATSWASLASYGIGAVTGLTNANVTLTPAQHSKPIITLSGVLTGNVQIVFPNSNKRWLIVNNTTGAYTVTAKTSDGTGVSVPQGQAADVYGDGTNIASIVLGNTLAKKAIFTANGSFTVPSGVTKIFVTGCGGGGGGGGSGAITGVTTGYGATGGGAGGGAAAPTIAQAVSVTPGETLTIVIGGAGSSGAAGSTSGANSYAGYAGGAGGNTTVTGTGVNVTLNGGTGGNGSPGLNTSGNSGNYGAAGFNGADGGDWGIAPSGYGYDHGGAGGTGGASPFGVSGSGGTSGTGYSPGSNAAGYGAGGGGAAGSNASSSANGAPGGNGAPGFLMIEW